MSQAHRFGTQSVYCLGAPQQKKGPVTVALAMSFPQVQGRGCME